MRKLKKYKPTKFMAEDSVYSKELADYAVSFIECLCHTKGTWAGKPFELIDWQEQIIRDVFGTIKPNGYRQFNTAYIEIPKKMGNSELAAAVALLLTCGDGEERAEVYGCAADRQQASIVFEVAADMVRMCPALNKRVKILASQKRIVYQPTNSFYQVLSAEAYSKHGFNIHGVVFDELHTQPKEYDLNPLADGVIISHAEGHKRGIASNHGDPEHLWRQLGMGYTMDGFRKDVKIAMKEKVSGTQATEFANLSEKDVIAKVGGLFTADQKKSGIMASVSLAQFILESGYGKSELAQNANNCFGMKKSLSGNTWNGSVWDGRSVYTKQTKEQNADGSYEPITADFRAYPNVEDSIADHSAYLLGAMNGSKKRYEGIAGTTDYKKVVQFIKDGGYATSLTYVEKLCSIIEKWNLTQYDVKETAAEPERWYRVRKSWTDTKSQKGAYKVLKNAKACADKNDGYSVYDWNGNVVYAPSKSSEQEQKKVSYRVRVSIKNLNIRKGPGINYDKTGRYTGIGVFTIVAESDGEGATKWGKLKSGAGWISLDYANKI